MNTLNKYMLCTYGIIKVATPPPRNYPNGGDLTPKPLTDYFPIFETWCPLTMIIVFIGEVICDRCSAVIWFLPRNGGGVGRVVYRYGEIKKPSSLSVLWFEVFMQSLYFLME